MGNESGSAVISVKDRSMAESWLQKVVGLNMDYEVAMKEAAETIQGMKDFAEGTMVDDFVNFADNLLHAADETFKAISSIATTVTSVLDTIGDFAKSTMDLIGNVGKKILGL